MNIRIRLHIVLYNPEIPPNTGNIARLCAGTRIELHLIEPLGFSLDDKYLKRAGLDYWPYVNLSVWKNFECYMNKTGKHHRLVMTSARGGKSLHRFDFTRQDALIFGPETKGLPQDILNLSEYRVKIPIFNTVRSLNLSTSAGIVLYQALANSGILDEWEQTDMNIIK